MATIARISAVYFLFWSWLTVAAINQKFLTPVLFLPGYGASKIYCIFESQATIPASCNEGNLEKDVKYLVEVDGHNIVSDDCVFDILRFDFNASSGEYSSPPGMKTFTELSGSFDSFDSIYESFQVALSSWGYKEGIDLFGVSYDYRLMSDYALSAIGFVNDLKQLVEKAYESNGQNRVLLAGHSNGGPTMYTFLMSKLVSSEWKQKYIAGMIGLSGNFLGQMNGIETFTYSSNTRQRDMTCSWEATLGSVTWGGYKPVEDIPIVTTFRGTSEERNYTAKLEDLTSLFESSGRSDWASQLQALYGKSSPGENTMDRSQHPGVDVYCLYGSEVRTSYAFEFSGAVMIESPVETLYSDGDGNQDISDNTFCLSWNQTEKASSFAFYAKAFPGVHHMEIYLNEDVLSDIKQIIDRY